MRVGGGAKSHACRGWGQESCVQGVGPGVMRAGGGRPEPYMQGVGPARSHVCRGWGQSHACRGWGQESCVQGVGPGVGIRTHECMKL